MTIDGLIARAKLYFPSLKNRVFLVIGLQILFSVNGLYQVSAGLRYWTWPKMLIFGSELKHTFSLWAEAGFIGLLLMHSAGIYLASVVLQRGVLQAQSHYFETWVKFLRILSLSTVYMVFVQSLDSPASILSYIAVILLYAGTQFICMRIVRSYAEYLEATQEFKTVV